MTTVVLAFSGGFISSVAVPWLTDQRAAKVVTVTLDVGQGEELGALRARALSCGAVRAHAIDAREELTREYLLPSLDGPAPGAGQYPGLGPQVYPLIASKLVDVARIEGARTVAHGASSLALDEAIHAIDPTLDILAPARQWKMTAADLGDYARQRGVTMPAPSTCRVDQTLWGRMVSWRDGDGPPAQARLRAHALPAEAANLEICFDRGVPVSVNGVPMSPVELVESVALIAGRYGIGRLESDGGGRRVVYDAPAAVVLHAARAAAGERAGVVRLSVLNGQYTVLAPDDPPSPVVNHA